MADAVRNSDASRTPRSPFIARRIPVAIAVSFAAVAFMSAACSSSPSGSPAAAPRPTPAASGASNPAGATAGTPTPSLSPSASATVRTTTPAPRQSPATLQPDRPTTAEAGLSGCPVAPADDIWRTPVDRLPASPRSAAYIAGIGASAHVHADFGSGTWDGGPIGIPITVVPRGTPAVHVTFQYAGESDQGPYPIPAGALIEGGPQANGDRHVLAVDPSTCTDYELYDARRNPDGSWSAGSGAVFHLRSDALRPSGWTSADAAGLPVLPGLARYDEAATGTIDHALRITVPHSQNAFVWPARHQAGTSGDPSLPPMGLRLRLKAGVDISGLPAQARTVAQALKTYGAFVADNGSAWYVSGAPDDRWNNDQLGRLGVLTGSDFEAVDDTVLQISANSGAARAS